MRASLVGDDDGWQGGFHDASGTTTEMKHRVLIVEGEPDACIDELI